MNEQAVLSWEAVQLLPADGTAVWTTKSLAPRVAAALPFQQYLDATQPPPGSPRIIALGGGTLIDRAKLWRKEQSPASWLLAVPSLWGSGAEASSVAVRMEAGKKVPHVAFDLRPDARAVWPALADTVPANLARWGMADTWSHALEAFLSPLASDALRQEIAKFFQNRLLPEPFASSPSWFELSAEACRLQSMAGVGLVHGMAHEIEPRLAGFGHARLCAALLWPVMRFNASRGSKCQELGAAHDLPLGAIFARTRELFVADDFNAIAPVLEANWSSVLRNPLSRINSVICRPSDLSWFIQRTFTHE